MKKGDYLYAKKKKIIIKCSIINNVSHGVSRRCMNAVVVKCGNEHNSLKKSLFLNMSALLYTYVCIHSLYVCMYVCPYLWVHVYVSYLEEGVTLPIKIAN